MRYEKAFAKWQGENIAEWSCPASERLTSQINCGNKHIQAEFCLLFHVLSMSSDS